ncbi:phosphotransferase enzyme family protein [Deinococcus navajonensis]|uniref:Phosphotransferase enzyme family protein n=1 Tax=Deinococcus navajonensis TaxID=309884 RepID=A0ABV8XN86_9DEIO
MRPSPDAVPPLIPEPQLADALGNYDLPGQPELRFLKRGFNDHYEVTLRHGGEEVPGGRYILRVYLVDKPYISGLKDIEAELEALTALAGHGVPVSTPLPRHDGRLWAPLEAGESSRPLALFSYAPGEELGGDAFNESAARNLGLAVAHLHAGGDLHGLGAGRYRLDETYLIDRPVATLVKLLGSEAGDLGRYGERLKAGLKALPRTPGPFGFVHGDLHTGNLRVLEDQPTFFDFDHAAQGWRAYDLAVLRMSLPDGPWAALLEGYRSVRAFTSVEEEALPLLARVRQLWDLGDFLAMRATGAWGQTPLSERSLAHVLEQVQAMQKPPVV